MAIHYILKWWKERKKLFPVLSDLSSQLFSLPATSVPSERIFSCACNAITEKRSRLLSHYVDRLVFIWKSKCLTIIILDHAVMTKQSNNRNIYVSYRDSMLLYIVI